MTRRFVLRAGGMLLAVIALVASTWSPMGVDFPTRGEIAENALATTSRLTDRDKVTVKVTPSMAIGDDRPTIGGVLEFHGIEVSRAIDCSYKALVAQNESDAPVPVNAADTPLNVGQEVTLCLH